MDKVKCGIISLPTIKARKVAIIYFLFTLLWGGENDPIPSGELLKEVGKSAENFETGFNFGKEKRTNKAGDRI